MPELPEVETIRQGLNQTTLAREIRGGDVLLDRTIAHPLFVGEFLAGVKGTTIASWHRRGKYLLAELKRSPNRPAGWLGVHLRMTGQLLWLERDGERERGRGGEGEKEGELHKHTRVRLFFAGNRELRFVDQRTFGKMWWVPPETLPESAIAGLKKLGPEPFSDDFQVEYLAKQLQYRRRPIKNALLDQAIVAGIGNIYADEALFISRIHPETLCSDLKLDRVTRLKAAIQQVLQTAIEAGGTTFSNFLNVEGVNGNYGGVAWVYNRTGQPCRVCGTPIQRLKLAGRSAHFCPQCQK
ncbi:MAG: DNA-formamidopyrimidine glycosylase [Cyanosarcina radialis HA8281-LM2]|nr:DNA-formamidopyrimidine glycosylase [Cyanosarcina radialis HA8281-LM2]